MSTSMRVNLKVEMLELDDGSYSVRTLSASQAKMGDKIVSNTEWTIRSEKTFKNKDEADKYYVEVKKRLNRENI